MIFIKELATVLYDSVWRGFILQWFGWLEMFRTDCMYTIKDTPSWMIPHRLIPQGLLTACSPVQHCYSLDRFSGS